DFHVTGVQTCALPIWLGGRTDWGRCHGGRGDRSGVALVVGTEIGVRAGFVGLGSLRDFVAVGAVGFVAVRRCGTGDLGARRLFRSEERRVGTGWSGWW